MGVRKAVGVGVVGLGHCTAVWRAVGGMGLVWAVGMGLLVVVVVTGIAVVGVGRQRRR